MRLELLSYLVCPNCRVKLDCRPEGEDAGEIISGALECPACNAVFPITRGIPRFVSST